jgi:hypothetical protein
VALRNAGTGIAVLDGWHYEPERRFGDSAHPGPGDFRRLSRDIYVPGGGIGFWQGALRDPTEPVFAAAVTAAGQTGPIFVDLLYGDHEGGQRMISRFSLTRAEGGPWLAGVSRHWSLDTTDPREVGLR